jgi:hypothetical protein
LKDLFAFLFEGLDSDTDVWEEVEGLYNEKEFEGLVVELVCDEICWLFSCFENAGVAEKFVEFSEMAEFVELIEFEEIVGLVE